MHGVLSCCLRRRLREMRHGATKFADGRASLDTYLIEQPSCSANHRNPSSAPPAAQAVSKGSKAEEGGGDRPAYHCQVAAARRESRSEVDQLRSLVGAAQDRRTGPRPHAAASAHEALRPLLVHDPGQSLVLYMHALNVGHGCDVASFIAYLFSQLDKVLEAASPGLDLLLKLDNPAGQKLLVSVGSEAGNTKGERMRKAQVASCALRTADRLSYLPCPLVPLRFVTALQRR
eukprot:scaffold354_cov234-Pinguiococcus_pyrenoidosus.AAC.4